MNDITELKNKIEKYRITLKKELDSISGLDWIVETEIVLWDFEFHCKFDDFLWMTMNYDMADLLRENNMDISIKREAYSIANKYTRREVIS